MRPSCCQITPLPSPVLSSRMKAGAPKTVVSADSRARYEKIVTELRALFDRHGLSRADR